MRVRVSGVLASLPPPPPPDPPTPGGNYIFTDLHSKWIDSLWALEVWGWGMRARMFFPNCCPPLRPPAMRFPYTLGSSHSNQLPLKADRFLNLNVGYEVTSRIFTRLVALHTLKSWVALPTRDQFHSSLLKRGLKGGGTAGRPRRKFDGLQGCRIWGEGDGGRN